MLTLLRTYKGILSERFGIAGLALFGSFARDEATESSDVDILVQFETSPDWKRYFGTQSYIENLLGRSVDLTTAQEL